MIVLDLEWNRGYDKIPHDEILQISAVRLDRLGGQFTDTFNAYIKPSVHKTFGPAAKLLPELQEFLDSNLDFPAAMSAFRQWCGAETIFASWGGDDVDVLNQNCTYWELPVVMADAVYDFQAAFSLMLESGQRIALWRAVEYCRIPAPFVYHNALHDAVYTAAMGEWMGPRALVPHTVQSKMQPFSEIHFPPQPRKRVGPFAVPEAVLDSRTGRRPACPVCGKKLSVLRWYFAGAWQYVSDFTCLEHGRFLCRMTLTPTEDGRWRGRLAVPTVTPDLLRAFERAAKGRAHICKGRKRKKRHAQVLAG